ncbi:unnamed protein product [Didymodactylos carnosus]|uniref:Uncharacterized protein n=1 Tax=Didymodactylos carnosus TaxID=1234261 RepID=A0A813NQX8_9BILA|nr:unnamed protein product [Didymodactylos carnosus]CAF0878704.1 unnamed protein product [Didymodactylos carnosus]CAF3519602.1 unnamed protein product [Didymodactylos carnosus]CAF3662704.1 unnamed protein product [Didymodactylos carnosus]
MFSVHFIMSTFEELTKVLLNRTPLPALVAPHPSNRSQRVISTPWNPKITEQLQQLQNSSSPPPLVALAALHLLNDDIGSCHDIVEKREGEGICDYLHAILHRREGDYWNSKYWCRRVKGKEFESIYGEDKYRRFGNSTASGLEEARKRAQAYVDRCEAVTKSGIKDEEEELKSLQYDEMKKVFEFARGNFSA